MSEHDLILGVVALSGAFQIGGLIFLALQVREARRQTRETTRLTQAVGGLIQETAKARGSQL